MPPTMPIVSPIQNPHGSVPKWRSHHQPTRVSPPTAAASSIPNPESFIHSVSAFLTPSPLGGRSVAQNHPACDKCHKRLSRDIPPAPDLLPQPLQEGVDRHLAQVGAGAQADGNLPRVALRIPDHEHVGDLLHLGVADLLLHPLR